MPDHEKVRVLARILGFPYDYFFQEDKIKAYTETTYFRSQATATKKDRAAQSVKLEFVAQMYETLWNYIDFPIYKDPKIDFIGFDDPLDCESKSGNAGVFRADQLKTCSIYSNRMEYWLQVSLLMKIRLMRLAREP